MELRLLVWLGDSPGVVCWLALALTYLVHSLLWAAAAALLAHRSTLSSAIRHLFWKMALVGPLVTALVASAVSPRLERGLGGTSCVREISWAGALDALRDTRGSALPPSTPSDAATLSGIAPSPEVRGWATSAHFPKSWVPSAMAHSPAELVIACGLVAAGLGLLRFLASVQRLRRRLWGRYEVTDARLLRRLATLRARTGLRWIKLTESPLIASPLVIGTGEICIPHGLLTALPDPEVDAVLAHELAHLERGDGIWFPVAGLVQCVLWLQPLNYWVSASFRQSAELACDDRAVELTGNPLGLARALVQVAVSASAAHRVALVPAMAPSKGALLSRVRRLTSGEAAARQLASGRGRICAIATIAALSLSLGSLNVRVAQARRTQPAEPRAPLHAHSSFSPGQPSARPPDAEEHRERMAGLAQREQHLTALLAAEQRGPDAQEEGSTLDSVRVLELSQELRHVRATQVWLEDEFVNEWDKARSGPPRAAR